MHDPVLVHVGYIKTATTFLQNQVFSGNSGELALAAGPDTRAQLVKNILLANEYAFDSDQVREQLERFAKPIRAEGKLPVWSEEMLLGNPPSPRYDGLQNAIKIHKIYPNAKILITIRRQQSIALSMYREYVLGGGVASLRSFIGEAKQQSSFTSILREDFLHYDRAIDYYQTKFGKKNVLVLPLEWISKAPEKYFSALSEFTGRESEASSDFTRDHVSEKLFTLQVRRQANRLLSVDPTRPRNSGFAKFLNRIFWHFNRLPGDIVSHRLQAKFTEKIRERYQNCFKQSNQKTMRLTGLPLDQLGYEI
ncbi:hypothetical protein KUV22_09805 [Microbulbifer agarilyticus]|uniref:hypothetical protein n=1 Tax=Microbulbifer agarilyticus TaxID=260552 RepID=UPI001C94C2BF|nr:hypothetical protein [Microbulbifer agarilyticus]MBY6190708.1 hypothetical protein [Microbulbifer agarilyticus]